MALAKTHPRMEVLWFKNPEEEGGTPRLAETKDDADFTHVYFSSLHPADQHECGLMIRVDGGVDHDGVGNHIVNEAGLAIDRYIAENPDGDPNAA